MDLYFWFVEEDKTYPIAQLHKIGLKYLASFYMGNPCAVAECMW